MALTLAQIESLWDSQGGNPAAAPTIAAISYAESGGNPGDLNNTPSTGDYSVGLFQTNYFGSLLGPRTAAYGSPAALQSNVDLQVKSAIGISGNGTNFSPWSTFKSGAYEQFLPAAEAAVSQVPDTPPPTGNGGGSGSGGTASGPATLDGLNLNPLDDFGIPGTLWGGVSAAGGSAVASAGLGIIDTIAAPLKAFVVNGALILFGLVFVLVGVVIMARGAGSVESSPAPPGGGGDRPSGETADKAIHGEGAGGAGGTEGVAEDVAEAAA